MQGTTSFNVIQFILGEIYLRVYLQTVYRGWALYLAEIETSIRNSGRCSSIKYLVIDHTTIGQELLN